MGFLKGVLSFLIVPLLPERFRRAWPWSLPLGLGPTAHISAYLHMVASVVAWFFGFILYQQAYAERVTALVADDRGSGDTGAITWLGMVTFVSFFFSVRGVLLNLYVIDSLARITHSVSSGEPLGSLFLWVPLFLVGKAQDLAREAKMTALYGKVGEPDRATPIGDGLLVRANRTHGAWHKHLTFGFGDRFYRLDSMGEGMDGERRCFEYRFRPWTDNEPIRSVVRLDSGKSEEPGVKSKK